jgi:hypothetical protein
MGRLTYVIYITFPNGNTKIVRISQGGSSKRLPSGMCPHLEIVYNGDIPYVSIGDYSQQLGRGTSTRISCKECDMVDVLRPLA